MGLAPNLIEKLMMCVCFSINQSFLIAYTYIIHQIEADYFGHRTVSLG